MDEIEVVLKNGNIKYTINNGRYIIKLFRGIHIGVYRENNHIVIKEVAYGKNMYVGYIALTFIQQAFVGLIFLALLLSYTCYLYYISHPILLFAVVVSLLSSLIYVTLTLFLKIELESMKLFLKIRLN